MSHSVQKHLVVAPDVYDVEIRRFVPGYEAMLGEIVGALEEQMAPVSGRARVLELGAGTGAVSERIAARFKDVDLILLDADPDMLERAKLRLAQEAHRIELIHGSFMDPLPRCHAAAASLALHHVHSKSDKVKTYRRIHEALEPGGVMINADAMISASRAFNDPIMKRWAQHLIANGDTEAEAKERFRQWADEDRFFGIEEELDMIREAGFTDVDVRWRKELISVVVAKR